MNTEDIHNICSYYNITNYTINDDLSIDVDGDVKLYSNKLVELPLRFRNVSGTFDCSYNNLTSLKGAPSSVESGFYCECNNLTSLKGAPSYVGAAFDCHLNKLKSLYGAPSSIGGFFDCADNPLESLKGITLNIPKYSLYLPCEYSYSDYISYFNSYKRDLKFKKIFK